MHGMESTDDAMYAEFGAWHGLGNVIEKAPTPEKAREYAGMMWEPERRPLYLAGPTGERIEVEEYVANVRNDTDKVLGVVGKDFQLFTNESLVDFIYAVAEQNRDSIQIETAGSLHGGRLVYMLARSRTVIKLGTDSDDEIMPYIGFFNGHDGSMSLQVKPITVRVVCRNTWNAAQRERGQTINLRHTSKMLDRIPAATAAIRRAARGLEAYAKQAELLAGTAAADGDVAEYFLKVFSRKWAEPKKEPETTKEKTQRKNFERVAGRWLQLYHHPEHRQPNGIGGTAWAAYNAISYWADHEKTIKGPDNRETRMARNLFGDSQDLKALAWREALETLTV